MRKLRLKSPRNHANNYLEKLELLLFHVWSHLMTSPLEKPIQNFKWLEPLLNILQIRWNFGYWVFWYRGSIGLGAVNLLPWAVTLTYMYVGGNACESLQFGETGGTSRISLLFNRNPIFLHEKLSLLIKWWTKSEEILILGLVLVGLGPTPRPAQNP
jgi:hypothetical protein